QEIFYARQRLVMAARAAGVDVYDTPFTDVNDIEGLEKDAAFAKALGFTGKASISPRHVEGINEAFSPTQAEIDYAHEVMDTIERAKAEGKGVVSLRGKMIDAPIVARAKFVLEMEKAIFGGDIDE
ncbi:MAG: aldolase/citrate lyase family protein, partial [Eubacteriales bacterium]|nr:aldolase/citrate lyase family protein [Eubacteriales bacterium]